MEGRSLIPPRLPAPGLRSRLALVALVLLIIPWVGYTYVIAVEQLLRESQQKQIVATARAVATVLQDRPRLALDAGALDGAATEQVRLLLAGLARTGLRIWVVDRKLNLVATAGNLETARPDAAESLTFGPIERLVHFALRPIFERVLRVPPLPREEFIPNDVVFGGREVERALDGSAAWRLRPAPGDRLIFSAAHPVWIGETVVGVVIVEESTDAILSLRNRAFEQLVAVTLIAFTAAAVVLLLFASRLSWRLRRLRDEAENAIDSQGRIRALVAGEHARDEIGDLSRSFSTMLERLSQYNAYLEKLAGRLTHELRTPVAVVRSSLDNLRMEPLAPDAAVYLGRAEDGLNRLETILTRMAEATRLEHAVRGGARELFDARAILSGCVAGYAAAYPSHGFNLAMPAENVFLRGSPDLFAQMLDKLAANAAEFAQEGTAVDVTLERKGGEAWLRFGNTGPLLPAEMAGRLFESMVSVRGGRAAGEPHLGLGLYIARLVAEFHGGRAGAANRADGSGVVFELVFPAAT